jgi:D-alanyl-D-alanine carboxypeptidase
MNKANSVFSASAWSSLKAVLQGLLIIAFIMTICASPADAARKKKAATGPNNKYASFVIDASTGEVLHQSNADKALYPASLTKVMTLLLVFEALDQGKFSLNDRITISQHAASMPPSKLGLKPGSSIRVKDAIYAVVTKSANDIAAALAEKVAGSESRFAMRMTEKARALGMASTTFTNASGLHNPRQKSTARDMAKLARYVIASYPDYYRFYSTKTFTYAGRTYQNHNHLMKTYKGMDGMKTGYTNPAGFNLVASAVRNNRRVIGIVFGGRSTQSRNDHMASLLDNAFAKLRNKPEMLVASADIPPVPLSKPLATAETLATPLAAPAAKISAVKYEPVPIPGRKPGIVVAAATLNKIGPAISKQVPTLLQPEPEMIGEGDAEMAADTIDLASAAPLTSPAMAQTNASLPASSLWAIQVGAYSSRAATDKALHASMKKLPVKYASVSPTIAPLKTSDGWLFRARLHGLSRNDAFAACRYLSECVPVAPKNN